MNEIKNIMEIIPIPSYFVMVIVIIFKSAPISTLTADPLEEKLYSKEKRSVLSILKHSFFTFIWFMLFYGLASSIKIYLWVAIISMVLLLGLFIYLISTEIKPALKDRYRLNVFLVALSVLLLAVSFLFFIPPIDIENDSNLSILNSLAYCLTFGLVMPILLKPGALLIKWSTIKAFYFKEVCPETEKEWVWYIHYPINKEFVLIGNEKYPISSEIKKIISKEKLMDQIIYSIDIDSKDNGAKDTDSSEKNWPR
ncbi:hypothetical protein ACGTN9_17545 [Halobacillus sp. MO56]